VTTTINGLALTVLAAVGLVAAGGYLDPAEACSVCFGDPDAPQTKAMAAGILFLLGVITTVLGGFAGMFCYWIHRSHKLALASEGVNH